MAPTKKNDKFSHAINRGKLCAVCLAKSKYNLSPNLIDGLKKFTTLFANISPYDERVPSGICDSCRNVLREKIKGKGQKKEFNIPIDFDFTSIVVKDLDSDSELRCDCYLSTIVSKLYGDFSKINKPKKLTKVEKNTEEKRLCSKCWSIIAKGLNHVCNDHTALENYFSKKNPLLQKLLQFMSLNQGQVPQMELARLSNFNGTVVCN